MGDVMVDRLVGERVSLVGRIESLKEAASTTGRDLSDEDMSAIGAAKERIARLDTQLEVVADDLVLSEDTRNRLALVTKKITPATQWRSSGEALWDLLHQGSDADARSRVASALRRAAEHMGTDKALTTPVAGDLGGMIVHPVIGPVIFPIPGGMPLLNGIGARPMPDSFAFTRPYIVDPNVDTGVGVQALEKAELPSKAFEVDADTLKAVTYGGYLNISAQLLQWVPGSLTVILDQLRFRLARKLDAAVLTEMGNSGSEIDLAAGADAAAVLAAIYDAAVLVFEQTGAPAEWIAMGPQGWARLGSLVDLANRPMFPFLGPSNAIGQMSAESITMGTVAGLRPIVTPGITDDSFWVGNGIGIEAYLYNFPVMEAVEPSVLGRQVAVAAALVVHRPTPVADGVVHITDVP